MRKDLSPFGRLDQVRHCDVGQQQVHYLSLVRLDFASVDCKRDLFGSHQDSLIGLLQRAILYKHIFDNLLILADSEQRLYQVSIADSGQPTGVLTRLMDALKQLLLVVMLDLKDLLQLVFECSFNCDWVEQGKSIQLQHEL